MKKSLIALMALAGVAVADIKDGVQWAESFDDQGYNVSSTFSFGEGKYFTFNDDGQGVADSTVRPYATNLGGKFSDAFTFSFKLVDLDAAAWADALSLYSNGTTSGTNNSIQIQKNNSGELMVYTEKFSGSNVADDASNINLGTLDSLEGKTLTLVFDATGATNTLTAYVDGVANADTVTFTYAEGATPSTALTGFQFGSAFGGGRASNSVTVDDIVLWNRALTAEEVASLPITTTVPPTETVPEPATATLSLLALAGLAARRRRR